MAEPRTAEAIRTRAEDAALQERLLAYRCGECHARYPLVDSSGPKYGRTVYVLCVYCGARGKVLLPEKTPPLIPTA